MATRGFEFAGNFGDKNGVPTIRDLPLDGTGAIKVGAALLMNSDGQLAAVTGSAKEITAIAMEARPALGAADGDVRKVAIVTPEQIWRVSMDASSTNAVIGYTKTLDLATAYAVDADDLTNGTLTLWNTDGVDDAGNVVAYVVFNSTTFGQGPGQVAYEAALALKADA